MNKIIICFFILLLQSCNSNESKVKNQNDNIVMPNDIRWVINSNEYDVLSEQIYYNAWDKLKNTLNDADEKSCIIMDLDETVLDNSNYQIGLIEKNESYKPESWSQWVNLKEAKLVPGAKEFIDNVRKTKTKIVFLSNRMASNQLPTIDNMKSLAIYQDDDIFMLRIDKPDKKNVRRSEVINGTGRMEEIGALKVLAYFGDARHDFPDPDDYFKFGENMFMFANPMYGKW